MIFGSIDEIYEENDRIRKRLVDVLEGVTPEEEALATENGKWTLSKVAEHLSKVDISMTRIAAKLLSKAKDRGLESDGTIKISRHFLVSAGRAEEEDIRFNAPEVVQPEGGQPISESISLLNEHRKELYELKPMFERYDGTEFTFPHPAFGELTAIDWLVLLGGHETRHTRQIERILSQNDAAKA